MSKPRTLLCKVFFLGLYILFFFVQLYLKYTVNYSCLDYSSVFYKKTVIGEKRPHSHVINDKTSHKVNIVLNKRYYPEQPIEIFHQQYHIQKWYVVFQKTRISGYPRLAKPIHFYSSKRGPPKTC